MNNSKILIFSALFLAVIWSLWFFSTFPHFVKYEKVPSGSFSTIIWDTSKKPWETMPSCALVTQDMIAHGVTWCDNFSDENHVNLQTTASLN